MSNYFNFETQELHDLTDSVQRYINEIDDQIYSDDDWWDRKDPKDKDEIRYQLVRLRSLLEKLCGG